MWWFQSIARERVFFWGFIENLFYIHDIITVLSFYHFPLPYVLRAVCSVQCSSSAFFGFF